jgi:hypothetical protein
MFLLKHIMMLRMEKGVLLIYNKLNKETRGLGGEVGLGEDNELWNSMMQISKEVTTNFPYTASPTCQTSCLRLTAS